MNIRLRKVLYYVLQWTCGIIQNLIGLVMWLGIRAKQRKEPRPYRQCDPSAEPQIRQTEKPQQRERQAIQTAEPQPDWQCDPSAEQQGRRNYRFFEAQVIEWTGRRGSMGMGMFIFYSHSHKGEPEVLVHEYGHTWQSAILGPCYLLVIGLPSFLWATLPVFHKMRKEKHIKYTAFYPESWANAWGEAFSGLPAWKK